MTNFNILITHVSNRFLARS